MEHKVTRKGRYKVENYSEHNTPEEAIQAATNKSIELNRAILITPPSYEVQLMGIGETISQNLGENTGTSGTNTAIEPPVIPTGQYGQLAAGYYETSKIPMEVINPIMGLTTGTSAPSYYYRCYPGLQWEVPISILGGAYPWATVILNTVPSGMELVMWHSINGRLIYLPVLRWANPITGSHSISITITDQDGTGITLAWTLTVTTNMAIFVDGTNGNNANDGSINSPFKDMNGWYLNSHTDSTYNNYHVYYRTGTYYTSWQFEVGNANAGQMKMRQKPRVHLAYPGESVTFDLGGGTVGADTYGGGCFCHIDGGAQADFFYSGVTIENVASSSAYFFQKGFMFGTSQRAVFYKNTFQNQAGLGVNGQNPAYFFHGDNTDDPYYSFHLNIVNDIDAYMLAELYDATKYVFEGNVCANWSSDGTNRFVYFKVNSYNISVRQNIAIDQNAGLAFRLIHIDSSSQSGALYDEIEYCWNNWDTNNGAGVFDQRIGQVGNTDNAIVMGQFYCYRNNLKGANIWHKSTNATGGPFTYANNVIEFIQSTGVVDGILDQAVYSIAGTSTNLAATSGLLDSTTNLLTGSNRTTYLYAKGCELPPV